MLDMPWHPTLASFACSTLVLLAMSCMWWLVLSPYCCCICFSFCVVVKQRSSCCCRKRASAASLHYSISTVYVCIRSRIDRTSTEMCIIRADQAHRQLRFKPGALRVGWHTFIRQHCQTRASLTSRPLAVRCMSGMCCSRRALDESGICCGCTCLSCCQQHVVLQVRCSHRAWSQRMTTLYKMPVIQGRGGRFYICYQTG